MFGRRKKKKKTQEQLNREDFVFKVWILSIFLCSTALYLTRSYNNRLLNLFIIIFFTGVALFAPAYFYPKMDWYYKLANNKLPNGNPSQSSTYIVIYNLVWFAALFIGFSVLFNALYVTIFIGAKGLNANTAQAIPSILSIVFRLLSFITALFLSIHITERKKKKLGGLNKDKEEP